MRISTDKLTQLPLNTSYNDALNQLGTPLRETQIDEFLVLRFNSNTQRYAHFLYFKDAKLVQKSVSTYNADEQFEKYVKAYGIPEKSLALFESTDHTREPIIHVWSGKGISVISYSSDLVGRVERYYEFSPTSSEEYFKTFGNDFVGNREISIKGIEAYQKSLQTSQIQTETSAKEFNILKYSQISLQLFSLLVLLFLIFLCALLLYKRRKSSR